MLTRVNQRLQPELAITPLTSVDMTTLADRLRQAMGDTVKPVDLARACGISRAAVTKWFSGSLKDLKLENLFAVAKLCSVEPEWLALGSGPMRPGEEPLQPTRAGSALERRHRALLEAYLSLPDEQRFAVRTLIETLAGAQNPRLHQFMQQTEARNHVRDKARVAPAEKTAKKPRP